MSRSSLLDLKEDLQSDGGAVLWSFVIGEQNEYPVTLNFITNADAGYTYEAVVIEANNDGTGEVPETIKPAGIQTTLNVRVPDERGAWSDTTAYSREDVVSYSGGYYKLKTGQDRISALTPDADPTWEVYIPNKIYIQFPSSLAVTPAYSTAAAVDKPIYGFFELRVTEPAGGIYPRTWKPMRGVVKLLFSPTQVVPDA